MENTLENKAKFFAQYWGQEVFCNDFLKNYEFDGLNFNEMDESDFLLLKPLSSITDEDAIEIAMLGYGKEVPYYTLPGHVLQGKEITDIYLNKPKKKRYSHWSNLYKTLPQITDYLRSKGYGLPFMGLSIEKQIEYGWVKLEELNND